MTEILLVIFIIVTIIQTIVLINTNKNNEKYHKINLDYIENLGKFRELDLEEKRIRVEKFKSDELLVFSFNHNDFMKYLEKLEISIKKIKEKK